MIIPELSLAQKRHLHTNAYQIDEKGRKHKRLEIDVDYDKSEKQIRLLNRTYENGRYKELTLGEYTYLPDGNIKEGVDTWQRRGGRKAARKYSFLQLFSYHC